MLARFAVLLTLAVAATGCSSPGADLPVLEPRALTPYRLGTGDEVRLTVFGVDALSNRYIVGDGGSISMPLIGEVPASGKTTKELESAVAAKLRSAEVVRDPSVSAQVEKYRPFFILGEVRSPGAYAYVPGMTVLTAVSLAGGYTFRAETDRVQIVRSQDEEVVEGQASPKTPVLPGDTVYV